MTRLARDEGSPSRREPPFEGRAATSPERDDAIARRAAAGEEAALRAIYDRHVGAVRRHVAFLLVGDSAVDDTVQATFLRAFRSLARFRGDCALSTWLYRIATNEARQVVRARVRRERREDVAGRSTPTETSTPDRRLAAREEAMRLLARLPAAEREAFVLCQFEERTMIEAARLVGVPPATLSSRLQRARQRLAQALRDTRRRTGDTR